MHTCLKYNPLKTLQNPNVLHALQAQIMLDTINECYSGFGQLMWHPSACVGKQPKT